MLLLFYTDYYRLLKITKVYYRVLQITTGNYTLYQVTTGTTSRLIMQKSDYNQFLEGKTIGHSRAIVISKNN